MTIAEEAKTAALNHCLYVIECRRHSRTAQPADYLRACDDIKLSIEAAIERVESGEQMHSTATTQ